jgi:hypothetical protein
MQPQREKRKRDVGVRLTPEIRRELEQIIDIQVKAASQYASEGGLDAFPQPVFGRPNITRLVNTVLRHYCANYTPRMWAELIKSA